MKNIEEPEVDVSKFDYLDVGRPQYQTIDYVASFILGLVVSIVGAIGWQLWQGLSKYNFDFVTSNFKALGLAIGAWLGIGGN